MEGNFLAGFLYGSGVSLAVILVVNYVQQKRWKDDENQRYIEAKYLADEYTKYEQEQQSKRSSSLTQNDPSSSKTNIRRTLSQTIYNSPKKTNKQHQRVSVNIEDQSYEQESSQLLDQINRTKPSENVDVGKMLADLNIDLSSEELLSRANLIAFLDLRWKFNGVNELQNLFDELRLQAMHCNDIGLYQKYVTVFEQELEERLDQNELILQQIGGISTQLLQQSKEFHFANETDFVWILNLDDFQHEQIPESFTIEMAQQIFSDIDELTQIIHSTEEMRLNQDIDLASSEANYIRKLALDKKVEEYQISERILKKMFFYNFFSEFELTESQ